MALISLSEAKEHLKVDQSDEDTLIQIYIDAAVDYIGNFLNNDGFPYKPAIKAAALLVVGDLYENRKGGADKDIKANPAVMNLLYPYRLEIGI